jgi:hypothetical protein
MRITSFHHTFLLLAGLLLSLHSLVPHVHGPEWAGPEEPIAYNAPAPNNNWLSLLQDFFTNTDLGEDHLEYFSPSQDLLLEFELELVSILPPVELPTIVLAPRALNPDIHRQRIFRSRHFPPAGVYPDADAPRGPPALT